MLKNIYILKLRTPVACKQLSYNVIEERGIKLSGTWHTFFSKPEGCIDSFCLPFFPFISPLSHFLCVIFFPIILGARNLTALFSTLPSLFPIHTTSLPGLYQEQLCFPSLYRTYLLQQGTVTPDLLSWWLICFVPALLLTSSMSLCPNPLTQRQWATDPSFLSNLLHLLTLSLLQDSYLICFLHLGNAHTLTAFIFLSAKDLASSLAKMCHKKVYPGTCMLIKAQL